MSAHDKWYAVDRAALEAMSAQELRDLLCQMSASDTVNDAQSSMMLEIMEVLRMRGDSSDFIRLDAHAAMKTFREEFLPSAELQPEEFSSEPDDADVHSAPLPAFLAAFTAGKKLSPQEEDEIRRMIDDFRKEMQS